MFLRALALFASLFVLWLLMSGIYKPLLLVLGVFSSALSTWIVLRLGLVDKTVPVFQEMRLWSFLRYIFWLTVEIGKADWAVTKVILNPDLPRRQHLIAVASSQRSDLGKALFANSITLTPGTLTVETEDERFIVHALNDEAADIEALSAMDARVTALEKPAGRDA